MSVGVTLWNKGGLFVWAYRNIDGSVTITGDDSDAFGTGMSFEYWIVIQEKDVPKLIAALKGNPGDDPLELLEANALKVAPGVRYWLDEHGIPADFQGV